MLLDADESVLAPAVGDQLRDVRHRPSTARPGGLLPPAAAPGVRKQRNGGGDDSALDDGSAGVIAFAVATGRWTLNVIHEVSPMKISDYVLQVNLKYIQISH